MNLDAAYYQLLSAQIPIITIAIAIFTYVHQNLKSKLGDVRPGFLLKRKSSIALFVVVSITLITDLVLIHKFLPVQVNRILFLLVAEILALGWFIFDQIKILGTPDLLRALQNRTTPTAIIEFAESREANGRTDHTEAETAHENPLAGFVSIASESLVKHDFVIWELALSALSDEYRKLTNEHPNLEWWNHERKTFKLLLRYYSALSEAARNQSAETFWLSLIQEAGILAEAYAEWRKMNNGEPEAAIQTIKFLKNQADWGLRTDSALVFNRSVYWITQIGRTAFIDNENLYNENLYNESARAVGWLSERLANTWDTTSTQWPKELEESDEDIQDRFAAIKYAFEKLSEATSKSRETNINRFDLFEAGEAFLTKLLDRKFTAMKNIGDQNKDFNKYLRTILSDMMEVIERGIWASIKRNESESHDPLDCCESIACRLDRLYFKCDDTRHFLKTKVASHLLKLYLFASGWLLPDPDRHQRVLNNRYNAIGTGGNLNSHAANGCWKYFANKTTEQDARDAIKNLRSQYIHEHTWDDSPHGFTKERMEALLDFLKNLEASYPKLP